MRTYFAVAVIALSVAACRLSSVKAEVVQVSSPLSRSEADKCPIPLPEGATNIYFAYYSDPPVYQCFVRFEAPYDQALAHVEVVFRNHARAMNWPFRMPNSSAITETPRLDFQPLKDLHVGWFDIGGIRKGITFGELNSWQPQIWIDTERNAFFFCVTD